MVETVNFTVIYMLDASLQYMLLATVKIAYRNVVVQVN